ncbi:probable LRR receptor-like serine/threonine-protein kinase At4g37250 [Cornus florida]|uniref:probable LRR receptor-like serine/threonine-protein kinase At4g37250 n=1 Tax=Cornus florida TaxID=4283 RepID=UPI002897794D|nr:probable LRR receptor-like serine/threonine-protein kinase At4g37250 [Cornus florida]
MSSSPSSDLHLWWKILSFFLLLVRSFGLNTDGILLLSFKYCVLGDPLGVLESWNYNDETPCSWNGVTCGTPGNSDAYYRVTGLSLPNSQLLGSIPADLGLIQNLRNLDLSNNSINGSIPSSLFNASDLQTLDFSNNLISGELPELVGGLGSLEVLNLSDNAFAGKIPGNLTTLRNLTVLSLKGNYFSGSLPSGFDSVEVVDLSSNLINGSLPPNFTQGNNLHYFNVSYNRLSGEIPPEFADKIPANATLDLSFNNFTGEIPESPVFFNQETKSFSGNPELCGRPLGKLCPIPSTASSLPNVSAPTTSPPAIAAIPKTIDSTPGSTSPTSINGSERKGLRPATIVGIVIGDLAGITIFALIFMHLYRLKKKKKSVTETTKKKSKDKNETEMRKDFDWSSSSEESKWIRSWACLGKRANDGEEMSRTTSSDSEEVEEGQNSHDRNQNQQQQKEQRGSLVTIDGEKELELETLLKASAYILGATGSSIMYKAVLEDGSALAVRRIGESSVDRFRDFENQVRVIAKLVHPNLVRIRGFYWGTDEKLVIYDFVPNGSLANARYKKVGSSPRHLPWEMRLKIAKGIARGLTYIHDKKHVHGNLKPSNILLGEEMEPKIGDLGFERLVSGETSYKGGGSARIFGSNRSTASRDSFHDNTPSPSPSSFGISPYQAPESLRSLKPNPKWDVFSFGVVLLELLAGKVIVSDEMGLVPTGLDLDEKARVLKMADVAIRADMEGKEDALLALFKLGLSCISPVPQKRPPMKEVLQGLEKFPSSSLSSSSSSTYHFMVTNNEKWTQL